MPGSVITQVAVSTPFDNDEQDFIAENAQEGIEEARMISRRITKNLRIPSYYSMVHRNPIIENGSNLVIDPNGEMILI